MLTADILQFQKMEFCAPWLGRIGRHVFHRHTKGRHFYCSTPVLLSHHDLPHRDVDYREERSSPLQFFRRKRVSFVCSKRKLIVSFGEFMLLVVIFLLKNIFSS